MQLGAAEGRPNMVGKTDDNIVMFETAVPGTPGEDYLIYVEVFMN